MTMREMEKWVFEEGGCLWMTVVFVVSMAVVIAFGLHAQYKMCKRHFPDEVRECMWTDNYEVRSTTTTGD